MGGTSRWMGSRAGLAAACMPLVLLACSQVSLPSATGKPEPFVTLNQQPEPVKGQEAHPVSLTIRWPSRGGRATQEIPESTNVIVVKVSGEGVNEQRSVVRAGGVSSSNVMFMLFPGTYSVTVECLERKGGRDTLLAQQLAYLKVQADRPVTLTIRPVALPTTSPTPEHTPTPTAIPSPTASESTLPAGPPSQLGSAIPEETPTPALVTNPSASAAPTPIQTPNPGLKSIYDMSQQRTFIPPPLPGEIEILDKPELSSIQEIGKLLIDSNGSLVFGNGIILGNDGKLSRFKSRNLSSWKNNVCIYNGNNILQAQGYLRYEVIKNEWNNVIAINPLYNIKIFDYSGGLLSLNLPISTSQEFGFINDVIYFDSSIYFATSIGVVSQEFKLLDPRPCHRLREINGELIALGNTSIFKVNGDIISEGLDLSNNTIPGFCIWDDKTIVVSGKTTLLVDIATKKISRGPGRFTDGSWTIDAIRYKDGLIISNGKELQIIY